jgi:glutamate/tyrosine decarboxylase-like PLP-dependent enzyme
MPFKIPVPFLNADYIVKTTAHDSLMTAVVGARSSYQRNHPGVKTESMIIYATTQTHSLAAKAGLVFGIQVRKLEVKLADQLSLRGDVLRNALEEDNRNGLHPFMLGGRYPAGYVFATFQANYWCSSRNTRHYIFWGQR